MTNSLCLTDFVINSFRELNSIIHCKRKLVFQTQHLSKSDIKFRRRFCFKYPYCIQSYGDKKSTILSNKRFPVKYHAYKCTLLLVWTYSV